MSFFNSRFVRAYLIPGAVFQSVVVGGGYGTGREIVEYFTQYDMVGGLLGMVITFICWAIVLAVTYEVARCFQAYDYRTFFKALLGPAWFLFEILYVLMLVLVLAVVASASGEILRESYDLPYGLGLGLMLVVIGILTFYGRDAIAKALTAWSVFLYAVFVVYFAIAFSQNADLIGQAFSRNVLPEGWALSGFKYAMYNLAIVPAILFASRSIETRKEAFLSGGFSALICLIPALLFHITFAGNYPEIVSEEIPIYWMIERIGAGFLLFLYVVMLFGTFIETGAGFIQGVNERLDSYLLEAKGIRLGRKVRALIAVVGILISAGLATLGIVTLIADGYGMISWGFFAVYVVPTVTFGVYKLYKRGVEQKNTRADLPT